MDPSLFSTKMPDAETDRGGKYEHRRQCEHNLQESLKFEGQASQAVKVSLNAIAGSYSDVEIMFGICRMHEDFENAFITPDGLVKKLDIGLSLKIKAQSFWPRSLGESLVGALTTQFNDTEGPYVDSDLIDSIKKAMAEVYFRLRNPPQAPIDVPEEEGFVDQTNEARIANSSSIHQHTPKNLVRLKVSLTKAKLAAATSGDQGSSTTSHGSHGTASTQNPESPNLPSSSSQRKGHGNHAHGAQAPWTPEEIAFCKSKIIEAQGNITWSQLAAACNQEFADKPVILASGLVVQRGTRTDQSMRQRAELKGCRQWAKAQAKTVVQGLATVQEDVEGEEVEGEAMVEE
ncbi:hypothetical protein KC332_g1010 [Hortaea werneckii]|nr:hypothetical protein KC358_g4408 [Hortaea werneckii]KAI6851603.1 hypothetical protein KC350_g1572 [Hortaea werneckii]KAI6929498.1 hypothetical protein KC348_g7840 [Hortaea werneckii]KAI6943993.1 hypothetical protein KC341_g1103 [Hortaea werneckii]KAI6982501.1 hypothetical protein KC321_g624 [Hortaea werneckii]